MSLDVTLIGPVRQGTRICSECGRYYEDGTQEEYYTSNITHNLNKMADAAGIYIALWRPEEAGFSRARDLVGPLTEGLKKLKDSPDHYREFNAKNGWGLYEHFVPWVEEYLEACKQYPDALIEVSR